MKTYYNYESLVRHSVSEEEIDEVYMAGLDYDLSPGADGNDRIMIVGWTGAGRLLEIGIEFLPSGDEHIFHAMDATNHYRELFEKDAR